MKKAISLLLASISTLWLIGCTEDDAITLEKKLVDAENEHFKVGILLPDIGLGDQSLNDLAINGLLEAQQDFDILWSYKEAPSEDELQPQLQALIDEGNDLIIGVGYLAFEPLEQLAPLYPDQQFLLIDTASDIGNIDAITYKEDEGSYLAGIVAAQTSKSGVLGFVGGYEDPVILKFLHGFEAGAQSVNPDIEVLVTYANSYADDTLGAQIARTMITEHGADVLYAAAGYAGVGLLQEAQRQGVYAIGVDTDQYFVAEKSVITSMTKNVDVTVYDYIEAYLQNPPTTQQIIESGIAENGVGLAPIRILPNANELEQQIEQQKATIQ